MGHKHMYGFSNLVEMFKSVFTYPVLTLHPHPQVLRAPGLPVLRRAAHEADRVVWEA